jgi:N-acetylmuramoyl-L-alanine amidase
MILLDNGHGMNTPGKRSPIWPDGTQLFEWEFTRDIVKRISRRLDTLGMANAVIVPEAFDVSLRIRCERANRMNIKYPKSFYVSVHGNAGEKPNQGTGWEVWTSPGQTESDKIASMVFESAKKYIPEFNMRSEMIDGDVDKESKFYVLVHTDCPAILTENLFYDNINDCRFMMSEEGRSKLAQLHIDAIIKYIDENR